MQGGLAQPLLRTGAPGFYTCITWAGYNQQEAVPSWHSRRQFGSCVGYIPVHHTSESRLEASRLETARVQAA